MPKIHYGYCGNTINALNGKCSEYVMVIVIITINAMNGKYLNYMMVIVVLPLMLWKMEMENAQNT